jgi:hypothetical protein
LANDGDNVDSIKSDLHNFQCLTSSVIVCTYDFDCLVWFKL